MERFQDYLLAAFGLMATVVTGTGGYFAKVVLKHEKQLSALDERSLFLTESAKRIEDKQDAMYMYLISNNPRKETEPPPQVPHAG